MLGETGQAKKDKLCMVSLVCEIYKTKEKPENTKCCRKCGQTGTHRHCWCESAVVERILGVIWEC